MTPRIFLAAIVLFVFTLGSALAQQTDASTNSLLGTWRLVSTKYGDATEHTTVKPSDGSRIKVINATHFVWIQVKPSGVIQTSAGGKYAFKDGAYTEHLEYGGEGMEEYIGKPQKFTIKITGDKLHQSGSLSDSLKIEETWERVK